MKMALIGKNKFGFIDGYIVEPAPNDPTFLRWQRTDNTVVSWILNSISKQLQSVFFIAPPLFQLKCELMALQQGPLLVSAYYTKLNSIWESLAEHKPAHTCTCNAINPGVTYSQVEYVMHFLMGLNDSFSSIRGQILSMDPSPTITRVFSLVVQDKKQKVGVSSANLESAQAFAVKPYSDSKPRGTKKDRPLCAHCGLLGHSKDKCFKLHDYPPIYKKNKSSQSATVNQLSLDSDNSQLQYDSLQYQLSAQQYSRLLSLLQQHTTNAVTPSVDSPAGNTSLQEDWKKVIFWKA